MATGTTITNNSTGKKQWFPTEIIPFLQVAKKDYRADEAGMSEGGSCLTSSFTSYCQLDLMQQAMDQSGQVYKYSAAAYAGAYNALF
jgi:hypothetical protein